MSDNPIKIGQTAICFDQMVWPRARLAEDDVIWRIKYGTPSREDLLYATSLMSAYKALIWKTQKERNRICSVLKGVEIDLLNAQDDVDAISDT